MADFPNGHVIANVTIAGKTKRLCITCGNDDLGKDGALPEAVTSEMLGKALAHRLEHGKCPECFAPKGKA